MLRKCKKFTIHRLTVQNSMTVMPLGSLFLLTLMVGCSNLPASMDNKTSGRQTMNEQESDISASPKISEASKTIDTQQMGLPVPTQILSCQDIAPNQSITVKGHLKLSDACNLRDKNIRFTLDTSNTSLDCNGATMSVRDSETLPSAITIKPKTNDAIGNISVANCHTIGYGHAIHIRQKTNPNERYQDGFIDPDANRALAPHHIRIINVSSIDSKNSGIFVGDHVHHVTFDSVHVTSSGTVGLYFEFGAQYNTVENSIFMDNGFRAYKPDREAIAVDAAGFNVIRNNTFSHNGAGGVHLYRNCFEHADDPSQSNYFKRTESAQDNIIENNVFKDEPVGVWVASRQSRNLKGFECGAYVLADTLFTRYHIDSAKNNKILNNTFIDVDTGIRVEDDGTQIIGNDFTQIGGMPYKVGSEIRKRYADNSPSITPNIVGTVIRDNKMP